MLFMSRYDTNEDDNLGVLKQMISSLLGRLFDKNYHFSK